MKSSQNLIAVLGFCAVASVGACAEDGYYNGGVGYGYSSYYDGAYGAPYWGWYGNSYYPGTGVYVYDRYRTRRAWSPRERAYWSSRGDGWRGDRGAMHDNWRGFDHYPHGGTDHWRGNRGRGPRR